MKQVFILCLSVLLFVMLPLFSSAVFYTPYASVTPSTSNISMLIQTMINQSDFDPFKDWIAMRNDQYDYSVFYNIDNGHVIRLRYYGVQSGVNIIYYYSKTQESNFSYNRGNYTIVGNTEDSLSSEIYNQFVYQNVISIVLPFLLVLFIFFVFRIHKRNGGIRV